MKSLTMKAIALTLVPVVAAQYEVQSFNSLHCPGFTSPIDPIAACDQHPMFQSFPGDSTTLTGAELDAYLGFCCWLTMQQ